MQKLIMLNLCIDVLPLICEQAKYFKVKKSFQHNNVHLVV